MALTKIPGSLLDTTSGINGLIYPTSDGTAGQFLKTDGSGNLSFATVTGYTDSDVETYLDGGTSTPTFSTATVSGTLTVVGDLDLTGDINSYNVTDLDITDQTITLGAGQTEALSGGSGIIVDGSLASILWDETNTEWDFNNNINVAGQIKSVQSGGTSFATTGVVSDMSGGSYIVVADPQNVVDNILAGIKFSAFNGDSVIAGTYDSTNNSSIIFGTETSGTITEKMRINSSGNVGIGTSNPQMGLHVGSGAQSIAALAGIGIANGSSAYSFYSASDGTKQYIAGIDHTITYTKAGSLSNHSHSIITNNTNAIFIDTSQNVGIGTSSPASGTGTPLTLSSATGYVGIRLNGTGSYTHDWDLYASGDGAGLDFFGIYDRTNTTYRMVVTNTGNVGIGTSTAPGANGGGLAIYKSDYPRITLRNSTSGDTTSDGFQAALVGSDMQWDLAESGNQKFFIGGGEYMRLNSLGQLCIGDASYFPTSGTNVFYMRKDSTSTQFLSHYNLQGGLVSRYYGDYANDGTIAELQIKVGDDGNEAKIQTWSNSVLKFGTNNTYAMEVGTNQNLYVGGTQQGADINDGKIFAFISSTNVPAARFAQGSTSTGIPVMRLRHENSSNGNYIEFRTDENVLTGKIYDSSGTMQYTSQSDQRLKENIEPMPEGLTEVLAMNPVKYTLKDIVTENKTIPMDGTENRGFLAQELNEQYPWAVEEGGEDVNMNPWGVDYGKLTPILVKAIQELKTELDAAKARITELENA